MKLVAVVFFVYVFVVAAAVMVVFCVSLEAVVVVVLVAVSRLVEKVYYVSFLLVLPRFAMAAFSGRWGLHRRLSRVV